MSSSEQARGSRCIVTQKDSTVLIENPENAGEEPRAFTFDNAYLWDSTQRQVYIDLAEPIISKAMEGFNGTIFAYGQTGSGKTYSMMGYDGDLGIIPLMNQDLFGYAQRAAAGSTEVHWGAAWCGHARQGAAMSARARGKRCGGGSGVAAGVVVRRGESWPSRSARTRTGAWMQTRRQTNSSSSPFRTWRFTTRCGVAVARRRMTPPLAHAAPLRAPHRSSMTC